MWRTFAIVLATSCASGQAMKPVTLVGDARDAKGGAVVVEDGGRVVYLDGVASWPEAVSGHRVAVTGRLVERKLIPDPLVNDAGERSAGAEGTQWVIEDAHWEPRLTR